MISSIVSVEIDYGMVALLGTKKGRTHRSATSGRHRRPSSGLRQHADRHHHLLRHWLKRRPCIKTEQDHPKGQARREDRALGKWLMRNCRTS